MSYYKLSEEDTKRIEITPSITAKGWDNRTQIRQEFSFTKGRIMVRGKEIKRGEPKRADYVLFYKPNLPLAIVEAKSGYKTVSAGIQQGIDYAQTLNIPFVYSSNGQVFYEHNLLTGEEREISLADFPTPNELWNRYKQNQNINEEQENKIFAPYYDDGSGRSPRYYQRIAINKTIEAIAKGQNRILLVMATGTGKTYTAFQIIWRLWKSKQKKRILFLADRNILVDQTKNQDFAPFGKAMTKITNRRIDKSYEIYLSLYQAVTGTDEEKNIYKEFSPDFFDLIVVDECHRGSAAEDSAWHDILTYFSSATQIGMTATPKEETNISTSTYFGEPLYTYSLKQGIDDGFLAPYKVLKIGLDKDLMGWRPELGKTDKFGNEIEDKNNKEIDIKTIPYNYDESYKFQKADNVPYFWMEIPFNHEGAIFKKNIFNKVKFGNIKVYGPCADLKFEMDLILNDFKYSYIPYNFLCFRLGGASSVENKNFYNILKYFYGKFYPLKVKKEEYDKLRQNPTPLFVYSLKNYLTSLNLKNFDYKKCFDFLDLMLEKQNQWKNSNVWKEVKVKSSQITAKLFSILPLLKIKDKNNIKYYKLFDFLPLLKVKTNVNGTKEYKLFNFLPIMKIKKK